MIFASSSDNTQKATEHLAVFNHKERRVLLPLPQSYQDAIRLVTEEFALPERAKVSFATQELPGCQGVLVEIHPRTWTAITPILALIIVNVETEHDYSVQRLASEAPTLPDEAQVEDALTVKSKSKEFTPSRDDQPAAVSKVRKRPSMAGPGNAAASGAPRRSLVRLSIPGNVQVNGSRTSLSIPFLNAIPSSSSSRAEPRASRVAATPPPPQLGTHEEDEDEEDEVPRSPRKGKSSRKRVISDDEMDQEGLEGSRSSEGHSGRTSTSGGSVGRALVTPKQERVAPPAKKARTPPRGIDDSQPSTAVARQAERIVNPSETCLITVDYDDGNEVCSSTFKTKGRHTVHKVLMTVCKTFGIEDLYPRVNLVRVITDSVDDPESEGDIIEQRFICPRNHTMTLVGAHNDARFAIEAFEDETDTA